MRYVPKTLPLREVDIPSVYSQRVKEFMDALRDGGIKAILAERTYLMTPGVTSALGQLGKAALAREMGKVAQAYDLLFLTVLIKEIEHDRSATDDRMVRSGEFESNLIDLIDQIGDAKAPTHLDEALLTEFKCIMRN